MKLKNIVIFMPSIEKGGADKNLFLISNFLSNKFKNVSVVTASNSFKKKFNKKIQLLTPEFDIWNKFGRKIKSIISILILLKVCLKKKNILIISFQSNIIAILLCKIFKIKIITRSNSFPNNWTKNLIKKYLFKKIYSLADHCIVNSLQTKKDFFISYKIKAICIYNPLDIKKIKLLSKKTVPLLFKKNKLKLINVGRLSEEKDHATFLNSLNLLKNQVQFDAIIMGNGKLKDNILKKIKHHNLQRNVRLINYQKNPYPFIKQADFVILTSLHEGLPNILLEAIALKKFIISSDCVSGPKEILSNGNGGALFKVKDFKMLKNKIMYYNKNQTDVKKKIAFASSKIHRFELNKNLHSYFKVIKKYIN